jgi:hypothetical protein
MAEKYEYLIIEQDLRRLSADEQRPEKLPDLLNVHGARGWKLDRFWNSDDGAMRTFIFRKESARKPSLDSQIRVFGDLASASAS